MKKLRKLKKSAYLLGVVMTGFLISACVQESRPPHVLEPAQRDISTLAPVSARIGQINHVKKTKLSPNAPMSQNIVLNGFNQVLISGDVSGTVNGGQPQNQLLVNGTVESLKHFSVHTQGGILVINSSEPVNISLSLANPVRELAYNGNKTGKNRGNKISATRIHMPNKILMIKIQSPAKRNINKMPIEIAQIEAPRIAHAPLVMIMTPPINAKNTCHPARQISAKNNNANKNLNMINHS